MAVSKVDDMGVRICWRATVLTAVAILSACSAGDSESSGPERASTPCSFFTKADASELLAAPVRETSWRDFVEKGGTSAPPADQARIDAAAERICMYVDAKAEDRFAIVQVDRRLFRSQEEFEQAFTEGAEVLSSPGRSAVYVVGEEAEAAGINVLLNDAGDSIFLSVRGHDVAKDQLLSVASRVASRAD